MTTTATTKQTRRAWLIGMVAALAPLVLGGRAGATPYESAPSNGSAANFKRTCKEVGGTFDVGKYSTACTYKNGAIKVCDEHGQNCTWHESAPPPPTGPSSGPFAHPGGHLGSLPDLSAQPMVDAAPPAKGTSRIKQRRPRRRHSRR